MSCVRFLEGSQARLTCLFTVATVPTDPTTVVCKIRDPSGAEVAYTYGTDPEVVRDGVGSYHLDQTLNAEGTWHHRWTGSGNMVAAAEAYVIAEGSAFDTP